MAAPEFSEKTKQSLAARACNICSSPTCAALTVGPVDAVGNLSVKLGEAAHIAGAQPTTARYDALMTDDQRASVDNGIWLCANCHTIIDKNDGLGYPKSMIIEWKRKHEATLHALLHSHRSPLPYLRRATEEGRAAQEVIDTLEARGAMFVEIGYEAPLYVEQSIDALRGELKLILAKVSLDGTLKNIIKDMQEACRNYMNTTSRYPGLRLDELKPLRHRIGVLTGRLRDEYGCTIRGNLHQIIPG